MIPSFARLSAALFIWYLAFYVLLPPPAVRPGLDESWRAFLTWAFQHGKQFGTEVIFTYGPWGFLLEPRATTGVYPWQIAGRLVLALAVSTGLALLGVSWIRSAAPRWLWAAAVAILAEPSTLVPVLLFFTTIPTTGEFHWKKPVLFLLAFAAGLAACTKFGNFILVASLMPVMLTRKHLAPIVPATLVSFVLFWLAAGQNPANLPAFLRNSFEISKGYASAMVLGRPVLELWLGVLICGLPLLLYASQSLFPITLERLIRIAWLAACELLVFRHGLIRNDSQHWFMAFVGVGIPIAILIIPLPWTTAPRQHLRIVYGAIVAAVLSATLWSSLDTVMEKSALFRESLRPYPAFADHVVTGGTDSVDVFTTELSYSLKTGLPIRNRPVIQSYTVYTKRLCEINAAFLESQDAPQTIYFHNFPIDNRYPTMEDSLAWRSLLTHYSPFAAADDYLVLKRRERPAGYELKPIFDRSFQTGETIEIPDVSGGLIWAELEVQRTPAGRLLDLLYRSEKMKLRLETNRRFLSFTLLNETTASGFLLSPYVKNTAALLDVYQPPANRFSAETVKRLLVHSGTVASLGFGRNVKLRIYELVIKGPPADIPAWPIRDLSLTLRAERSVNSATFAPTLEIKNGELRLLAGASSSGWIPRPAGQSVSVRYGTDPELSTCSGAVSFRIHLANAAGGERHLLWEAAAKPKPEPAEATVNLPPATGEQKLYFETQPADKYCAADGAYWSDIRPGL